MKLQSWARALLVGVVLLTASCESLIKFRATRIGDIVDHPRNYENREVTVYGTVTAEASLLVVKYFEIKDDTGSIKVITTRVLPQIGEKVAVTGTMESIEIGAQRWIVIREKGSGQDKEGTPS